MGYCRSESEYEPLFNRNQEAICGLHSSQEGLDENILRRMLEDYDRFYYTINRPNEVARTIMRQCRERQ
jgi:hypothetical protein